MVLSGSVTQHYCFKTIHVICAGNATQRVKFHCIAATEEMARVYQCSARQLPNTCFQKVRHFGYGVSFLTHTDVAKWLTDVVTCLSLPANRAFQNRKSGWSTRLFFWFGKGSTTNGKIRTVPVWKSMFANCCHFHLISPVSRSQRPLIVYVTLVET